MPTLRERIREMELLVGPRREACFGNFFPEPRSCHDPIPYTSQPEPENSVEIELHLGTGELRFVQKETYTVDMQEVQDPITGEYRFVRKESK